MNFVDQDDTLSTYVSIIVPIGFIVKSFLLLFIVWSGHQESNLELKLRRLLLYPFNYGQLLFVVYQIDDLLSMPYDNLFDLTGCLNEKPSPVLIMHALV